MYRGVISCMTSPRYIINLCLLNSLISTKQTAILLCDQVTQKSYINFYSTPHITSRTLTSRAKHALYRQQYMISVLPDKTEVQIL